MAQSIQEWTKWNLWKTAFKKFEVTWSAKQTISLQIFKGCLPQILLGPFLNTFSYQFQRRENSYNIVCNYFLKTQKIYNNIINTNPWKRSLTSREIPKESQKPSVTKTYLVGLNHDAELPCKKWSQKRWSLPGYILCKRIKQSDCPRKFGGQNLRPKLINYLKWLTQFAYLHYTYAEYKHHSSIQPWNIECLILGITFNYTHMPNHMQKINFIPNFIIEI